MTNPSKTEASIPGFQGSETTRCEVTLYGHGGDPILFNSLRGEYSIDGKNAQSKNPSLINCSTAKSLEGTGQFQLQLKHNPDSNETPLDIITDDDWVDVVFKRHDRVWTVMRGLVDEVRRVRTVSGTGATSTIYNVIGRDFQKIWETTEAWFNVFSNENVAGAATVRIFTILENVSGDPAETVQGYLLNFLRELEGFGRANWNIPPTMPGIGNNTFSDIVTRDFRIDGFSGLPIRTGVSPNFMNPTGNLWSLAKEWSDPAFTELFCDVSAPNGQPGPGEELFPRNAGLSVYFRDKPFILRDTTAQIAGLRGGTDSPWFRLPTFIVPRQQILADDIGRSGMDRINAFFMSPQMSQELIQTGALALGTPFWNTADIKRHGMRRYDISSRYVATNADLITLSKIQRSALVDWYALNPYFLNGSFSLGIIRPDIRIGTRIRIPGDSGDTDLDETYYVETVNHSWNFQTGGRTTLGVTRGYKGDDQTILSRLDDFAGRFKESPFTPPPFRSTGNPIADPDIAFA